MDRLGPSSGFREHVVAVPFEIELTDAVVELAARWAVYKWGTSAGVVRVDHEGRTIMVRGPDVASVPAELVSAIERGVLPEPRPGTRRKPKKRR